LALHSKEKQELSVLHLVGSRVSKYYFNLSWFWSNEVKKLQHVKEYFVVVHPDGFWQIRRIQRFIISDAIDERHARQIATC